MDRTGPGGGMLVAQVGARMHYAVPRILARNGLLDRLVTDLYATRGWPRALSLLPEGARGPAVRRLQGRQAAELPRDRVAALSGFGLAYALRQARARGGAEALAVQLWAGRAFSRLVRDRGFGPGTRAVYGFNSASLELLEAANARGLGTVLEQTIAPRSLGLRLLAEERRRFPGWEPDPADGGVQEAFAQREFDEWAAAGTILCGSDFVRDGIKACGGPAERCVVVPYGVDGAFSVTERSREPRPLRVLTVGEVGLRKGSPYVAEAARRAGRAIEVRMVGGSSLLPHALAELGRSVELTGPVPRAQVHAHYAWADVFLLPSLVEGSATVTYEALAAGLPVVCTPNAGSIVRDGLDGFVVPVRDVDAILDRLGRLADPDCRAAMAASAAARAATGRLDAYEARLLPVLRPALGRPA